jgi:hypothetical protein
VKAERAAKRARRIGEGTHYKRTKPTYSKYTDEERLEAVKAQRRDAYGRMKERTGKHSQGFMGRPPKYKREAA